MLRNRTFYILEKAIHKAVELREKEIALIDGHGWKVMGRVGKYLRHWVQIGGKKYPQKWVFRILFSLQEDFHQKDAEDFFINNGFLTGEL